MEQAIKLIRTNIDDHAQIGLANEISIGKEQVYQMNNHNIWDLVITDSDGEIILEQDEDVEAPNYVVYPQSGQIRGLFPEGEITFRYTYAGFTDEEITLYYELNGNSINKTTLNLIEILLASAAKRFDYKAGLKDIKASQVYNHLKDLRDTFRKRVDDEEGIGDDSQIPMFVNRVSSGDRKARCLKRDVSRVDVK